MTLRKHGLFVFYSIISILDLIYVCTKFCYPTEKILRNAKCPINKPTYLPTYIGTYQVLLTDRMINICIKNQLRENCSFSVFGNITLIMLFHVLVMQSLLSQRTVKYKMISFESVSSITVIFHLSSIFYRFTKQK